MGWTIGEALLWVMCGFGLGVLCAMTSGPYLENRRRRNLSKRGMARSIRDVPTEMLEAMLEGQYDVFTMDTSGDIVRMRAHRQQPHNEEWPEEVEWRN